MGDREAWSGEQGRRESRKRREGGRVGKEGEGCWGVEGGVGDKDGKTVQERRREGEGRK